MKELKLVPPNDPRVQSAIAPFTNEMLKDEGFKDRKELSDSMFAAMKKYGGIGLTCNQVGLPFNMFVLGDHVGLENGLKMYLEVNKMTDSIEGIFCVGLTKEEIKEMFGLDSEPAETLNT